MSRGQGKRTLELVRTAEEILDEIHPASVRALCYRLFVAGLILNMGKSATNGVSRLIRIAREDGDIPWEWIVDESREAETVATYRDPDELIRLAVNGYRRDAWQAVLPTFSVETKRKDPRYKWFKAKYGKICCELDALPPPELRERVKEQIRGRLNLGLWAHARKVEKVQVDSMQLFHKSWRASASRREKS
jgi:hypothetical protein